MSNVVTTNIDAGNVILDNATHRDKTFTAPGAGTTPSGTVLATVTATGKLVPYAVAGSGGAAVATDVLTYDVVATGAGDIPIRSMVSGRVRKERLLIPGAVTEAVIAQLRLQTIIAVEVEELGDYDNAAS